MVPISCRAACAFVLRQAGRSYEVLLLERADSLVGTWCQVAGSIEEGETAWQCVLREIAEETGLIPHALWSADYCEQFYVAAKETIEIIPVFVAFVDADCTVTLNEEHSDHVWLPFEQAREKVSFSSQRSALSHIEAEFILREPPHHLLIQQDDAP